MRRCIVGLVMAIVCSSCEVEPGTHTIAGAKCAACGEPLISVETSTNLVGTNLDGRFEIVAPLGKGGMGVVYRAKQLSIGREVAIKVLDHRIERDVGAVKRFFREAKVASTLAHPNTVPIVDFGQSKEGRLYLVMELVQGRTLNEEVVRVGPLPLARCVTIGTQLCDALEAAHTQAIVHRDLKLENVMLLALPGGRDHIKILDFGLARVLTDPSSQMTATGLISGTPRYMPPEVAIEGAPPAPPQDMYAVGVMLAELSIGRALWTAPTLEALFLQKEHLERSIADVPEALKPLVRALLANDPAARPTAISTREMLRMIDNARPALQLELDAPPPRAQGSMHARASSPLALEPTQHTTPQVDPYANLNLVALDELGDPPKPKPAPVVATMSHDDGPLANTEGFGPPQQAPIELELDRAYVAERSQKLAERKPAATVGRKKSNAALIISLLVIALVGAGAAALYFYQRKTQDTSVAGPGVSIRITAERPIEIKIDGKRVGKTPFSYKTAKGTKPLLIESDGFSPRQIVPDRDQTVQLEPTD